MHIPAFAIVKYAVDVSQPAWYAPSRLLASTVGRALSAPVDLLVRQEAAPKSQVGAIYHRKQHEEAAEDMAARFPKELEHTAVRLGGARTFDDIKRVWQSPHNSVLSKLYGTGVTPFWNAGAAVSRSDHYNPFSDVATVYSGLPSTTSHELGHAVDYNRKGWFRAPYFGLRTAEMQNLLGFPGPMTHYQEIRANQLASQSAKDEDTRANMWRRLAPAYGTYAGATGLGGLVLHHELARSHGDRGKTPLSHVVQFAHDKTQDIAHGLGFRPNSQDIDKWMPLILGLGAAGTGALAGRGVAEVRNLIAKLRGTKEEKK